jgi:hypothetical protein
MPASSRQMKIFNRMISEKNADNESKNQLEGQGGLDSRGLN